ncbi:MAG: hypothetical protein HQL07_00390 [Nitrospirae bacterium]|nr:hypothetical protein [Magnetococcales bacterium]
MTLKLNLGPFQSIKKLSLPKKEIPGYFCLGLTFFYTHGDGNANFPPGLMVQGLPFFMTEKDGPLPAGFTNKHSSESPNQPHMLYLENEFRDPYVSSDPKKKEIYKRPRIAQMPIGHTYADGYYISDGPRREHLLNVNDPRLNWFNGEYHSAYARVESEIYDEAFRPVSGTYKAIVGFVGTVDEHFCHNIDGLIDFFVQHATFPTDDPSHPRRYMINSTVVPFSRFFCGHIEAGTLERTIAAIPGLTTPLGLRVIGLGENLVDRGVFRCSPHGAFLGVEKDQDDLAYLNRYDVNPYKHMYLYSQKPPGMPGGRPHFLDDSWYRRRACFLGEKGRATIRIIPFLTGKLIVRPMQSERGLNAPVVYPYVFNPSDNVPNRPTVRFIPDKKFYKPMIEFIHLTKGIACFNSINYSAVRVQYDEVWEAFIKLYNGEWLSGVRSNPGMSGFSPFLIGTVGTDGVKRIIGYAAPAKADNAYFSRVQFLMSFFDPISFSEMYALDGVKVNLYFPENELWYDKHFTDGSSKISGVYPGEELFPEGFVTAQGGNARAEDAIFLDSASEQIFNADESFVDWRNALVAEWYLDANGNPVDGNGYPID